MASRCGLSRQQERIVEILGAACARPAGSTRTTPRPCHHAALAKATRASDAEQQSHALRFGDGRPRAPARRNPAARSCRSTRMPPRLKRSRSSARRRSTVRDQRQALRETARAPRPPLSRITSRNAASNGARTAPRRIAVPLQHIERKIDAILQQIHRHILPEIGELQRGAGGVGKALALGVASSRTDTAPGGPPDWPNSGSSRTVRPSCGSG